MQAHTTPTKNTRTGLRAHPNTCTWPRRRLRRRKRLTIQVLGKLRFKRDSASRNRRTVTGSRRENPRFVQQRIYSWSKYCLKRSVLRLDLKAGREGLWRTAKGREFQTCAAEKQKAQPRCCFLSKVSMQTILPSEEECILWRDIDLDKVSQVLIAETSYFVFNSLFYWEPVKLLEKTFGVLCSTRFKDNLSWPHTAETNNDSLGDMVVGQEDRTTCHGCILLKQTMALLGIMVIKQENRATCHDHTAIVCQLFHSMWPWLSGWRWSHQTNGQDITTCHVHTAMVCWLFHSVTYWVEIKSSDKWTGYNNLSCSHSNGLLTISLSGSSWLPSL